MASKATTTRPAPQVLTREEFRERLYRPLPQFKLRTVLVIVAAVLFILWGLEGTNASPAALVEGIPNIADFISRLFPPRFDPVTRPWVVPALLQPLFGESLSLTYPSIFPYVIETVQMALIGTLLAIFLSAPFGLLAARNTAPHPFIYSAMRMLLNINRAIPDIIFALVFVAAVGLGPFGGVLALAIGSIGSTGKLYAEAIEAIDPRQVQAVRATGANRLQSFRYGVVPQALPLVASYSLLLFEHNVRSATILGLVGAGGVGFILSKYISLFQYRDLMGALIWIILMVAVIDRISDYLRKKII
ncbi:MAG: phosphonate ABC transporter, permease protein PhnE [Chloroflexales bacterium]|nr:phosphonate ABC transporter, permease protein PhnE [Chloroflexales bacterium]